MKKPNTFSEVPKEWKIVRIEDVIEDYQNGYAFSAKKYAKSGLPIVSMSSISLDGRFQFSYDKCKFWDESKKEDLKSFLLKKGDVIIAMTDVTPDKNLIGRMALVTINDTFLLNQRVGLFRLKKDVICNKFLAYIGNSSSWINYCQNISSQGAQANIGTKDIRRSYIPLPPLPEQQEIADILSTVDEKITLVDQQITATEELKKALMQRLLTKGIGHTEFKDSPVGKIPKSWEVKKFTEVCLKVSKKFDNKNGKCIELEHIEQRTGQILGFDEIKGKSSIKNHFISGDVLFCKLRPYLRKYWHCNFEGGCSSELLVLRSKEKFSNLYLFYTVQRDSFISHSISKSFGTKMPRTSWKIIGEYYLGLPSLSEQKQIAKILSNIDIKLRTQKDKKQSYQELKKGLMQQLLTGKIRVDNLIEA